jgi:hypothetical protein
MTWRGALAFVGLAACRLGGGPSANPDDYVAFPSDASADDGVTAPPGDNGNPLAPGDEAGATSDNAAPLGDDADDEASGEPEGGTCSPMVAVCDPVHNTGCNALMQCDVNPLGAAGTPSGLCVFGGSSDAGLCLASAFTESCAPRSTCTSGACRQLCFCDGDCPSGQCCSDSSGPPGFTLCGSCP